MTKRSPLTVFLLSIPTCGIYCLYWLVKTKTELNQRGGSIPTAWIILVPFIGSLYFYWKYSEAVALTTKGETSAILSMLLLLFTGPIGQAVLQSKYNSLGASPVGGTFGLPSGQLGTLAS